MQKYRFKFYLNAVHSIELNGLMGQEHPHTWEIGLDTLKSDESFVMFTSIEKGVEQRLSLYQDKNLNTVPPFDKLNPTLENVSIYFKKILEQFLIEREWFLTRIEVSETPTRSFIIDSSSSDESSDKNKDMFCDWIKTIEKEVDKYIEDKEEEAFRFPHVEVNNLMLKERAKIKRNKIFFSFAGVLVEMVILLLILK